ncbi:TPA: anti-sigma factor domain-containing protein [Bacillus cereus]|nr:anti-sigma factor domain-containing protein [Bacillus cereus]HDR7611967.1 anti-sigma factor domain-containing protein [Bacillus mycoides]
MMNKGIVMDIKKHSVVVLTPNGEFITFKRQVHSYMIGEEILFNKQEQRAPRFSIPSFLKPASLLVTCFLCVLLFFYNQPEEKVFAYVSVDINPSLEVSVTKDLRVIDLRACNDDGRRILKEMKRWENNDLQDVIRTIIKQSQEDKYLTNDKQVMLTAVTKDKSLEPQLEKAMQKLKKEYETKHVTVVYQSSTMQMRENAKKAGVGTGVYIKQDEKQKSITPPVPPSNQGERDEEIHSQPKSSPDVSSDSSPVKEERYEKQERIEQKQSKEQQPKQIKENNGHQQENNGRGPQKENNGHQQENDGRGPQKENNGHQQENNGRGPQKENNGHQQENNGRGPQKGNNGHQQENNGRGPQKGNNGHQQENNGRGSQGNNGHQQENNGRGSQGNNGHEQENNGRGSQQGNINENNGPENEDKNVPTTQHQGNEKKNL